MNKTIRIEVVYGYKHKQAMIFVDIEKGSTIEMAILKSGILALFPDIDLTKQKVGVFSKIRQLQELVEAGDRIEIYRPLLIDPKEARRKKSQKKTLSRANARDPGK